MQDSIRDRDVKTDFWTQWEKGSVGWFERIAWKYVYYHMWNWSPIQLRCMRQGALSWCIGITMRYGMGWEEDMGFRMGNTCVPMADTCEYMAKLAKYCKVISLQLKFINLKKKSVFSVAKSCPNLLGPQRL